MKRENQILVAGIGNTIRGDDSIGIHLARRLKKVLPPRFAIEELDAGSLSLMDVISGYGKVILIDTIQTLHAKAGKVHHFSLQDFKYSAGMSSAHGLGLKQVVELESKLMGREMPPVDVLAVEARKLDEFSEELSPELEKQFDEIVEKVRAEIVKTIRKRFPN